MQGIGEKIFIILICIAMIWLFCFIISSIKEIITKIRKRRKTEQPPPEDKTERKEEDTQ